MNDLKIKKLKNFDPQKAYIIKGSSMQPYLQTGDILVIDYEKPFNLKKGDIIAFNVGDGEKVVVHRLLKIEHTAEGLKLITKGDNNISYDSELKTDEYVGRGSILLRGNKTINLKNPVQRLISRLLVFMSVKNLNLRSFKLNPLTGRLKKNSTVIKLVLSFYSSDYQCTIYPIPDSNEKLIRAFCKKRCFAHGIIEKKDDDFILKNWSVSFPFYHTSQGKNFLTSLINHTRENSKRFLTIKNLYRDNPVRNILDKYDVKNASEEPGWDFSIDINALKTDFACNNG